MTTPLVPTETIYALEGDEWDGYLNQWRVTAPAQIMDALDLLAADFDGATCQMDNCGQEGGASVGWTLHDNDDERSMHQQWNYTALVDTGKGVFRCCEDCHAALLPKAT